MELNFGNADYLTGLYNENYLVNTYSEYISKHTNSSFIMIDFKKFKYINDTYGHKMGDKYLRTFSALLKLYFSDSLVIRLHGDEFCLVTDLSNDMIVSSFEEMNMKIDCYTSLSLIPEAFRYNAGITSCEEDLNLTMEKADNMMYYAKRNDRTYQFFEDDIWKQREKEKEILDSINNDLKLDSLQYYRRDYVDINKQSDILLTGVSTKNSEGVSIFNRDTFKVFKENSELSKIDLYNIRSLLTKLFSISSDRVLMNIDYKTLIIKDNICKYLESVIEVENIDPRRVVIGVNLNGITTNEYPYIARNIQNLKSLGFNVCIDGYDSSIINKVFEDNNLDYIKIKTTYWRDSMNSNTKSKILLSAIDLMDYMGIKVIFPDVLSRTELDYIKTISNSDTLVGGDFVKKEEKIKLK